MYQMRMEKLLKDEVKLDTISIVCGLFEFIVRGFQGI